VEINSNTFEMQICISSFLMKVKNMKFIGNYTFTFLIIGILLFICSQDIKAAPPANDNLANFQTLSGASGLLSGTTIDATRESGEAGHDASILVQRTVWFEWTATENKPVIFEITSANFDAAMGIYTGNTFPLTPISRNNDTSGNRPRVEFGAFAGTNYKIVIGLSGADAEQGGNFTLNWTTANSPTNDNFANAMIIENPMKGSVSLAKLNATTETGEPVHINGNKSVWFNYTNNSPTDFSITFSTQTFSLQDTTLAVYTGSSVNNLTPIVKNDNAGGSSTSRVTFLAKSGVTYRIAVDEGANANSGSNLLNWDITKLKGYTDFGLVWNEQTGEILYDDAAEISVFRPSEGVWYWINSNTGSFAAFQFGANGDMPVPSDYDGDGRADLAVVRESNGQKIWWVRNSFDESYKTVQWGLSGDKVLPGDYDADGRADFAVFRPSNNTWYILRSSDGQAFVKEFGLPGDIPVLGDFIGTPNGTDLAVFRPSNGTWYIFNGVNTIFIPFGLNGDKPVVGDYDNDGKSDVAVYRPPTGIWYVLRSRTNQLLMVQWGLSNDIPMSGDYDNNTNDLYDFAVFRPSDSTWYIQKSQGTVFQYLQFGISGDIPVSSLSPLMQ